MREAEGDDDEEIAPALKLPAGTKNYITPGGHARLKSEFEHLVKRERPHIVEVVAWAASNGDRSENGDYIYGKRRLREIDRRMGFLQRRLKDIEIVKPDPARDPRRVFFGATVEVEDDDGETVTYTIVGVDETDVPAGRISWQSPIGRALLGKRLDETVKARWKTGPRHQAIKDDNERELTIIDIRYED